MPGVDGGRADDEAMRVRWRLDLAYEGTNFRGWAKQPGFTSVEGLLEEALATVLRERVRLSVAGRTDAGVHAWAQVASFSCARRDVVPERLRLSLNALLPPDVAVLRVSPAPPGFVAREAASRTPSAHLYPTASVRSPRPRGPTTGRRLTETGGACASRSRRAASSTTWSASPWARWSTWRRAG